MMSAAMAVRLSDEQNSVRDQTGSLLLPPMTNFVTV